MDNNLIPNNLTSFDQARKLDDSNNEFWYARDIQIILQYSKWENFVKVIEKAREACKNSGFDVYDHFPDVKKMVQLGSGAIREIEDVMLSRYACYLIIQNADPSKEIVAHGQAYFAIQTRKQEIFEQSSEDEKRLMLRDEIKKHNTYLAAAAKGAGVETGLDFAIFQNHGYQGLYGGLDQKDIHRKKGLKKSQKILDHMGSTELAANLFRATQTEEKLRRENVKGKEKANHTHFKVGAKVRQTIEELGGTMPEELPTEESIKKVERRLKPKKKIKGKE